MAKNGKLAVERNGEKIELDVLAEINKLEEPDQSRMLEAFERWAGRPAALTAKPVKDGDGPVGVQFSDDLTRDALKSIRATDAMGTGSQHFTNSILGNLIQYWQSGPGITDRALSSALAIIEGAAPQNELECQLVVQMIIAHENALWAAANMRGADSMDAVAQLGNMTDKFMRTYTMQMEALAKLRRGGEQVVKYVHVHEGGQAVVAGTINQSGGRGDNSKSGGQPRGVQEPAGGIEGSPALSCPDAAGDIMPIARDAKRKVPVARRQEPRRTAGE
nr:hypothetical protein [Sphingomicrobium flavum]